MTQIRVDPATSEALRRLLVDLRPLADRLKNTDPIACALLHRLGDEIFAAAHGYPAPSPRWEKIRHVINDCIPDRRASVTYLDPRRATVRPAPELA